MSRADLVFRNGKVVTLNDSNDVCSALAVTGDRIVAVGTDSDMEPLIGPSTQVVDLRGRTLMPGFNEAHNHLISFGLGLLHVDVSPRVVDSIEAIKEAIRARAQQTPPGQWIIARGYDHTRLKEGRHPTRDDLDAAAPHHPVLVSRTCYHIAVANSKALEIAGVTDDTADPPGGQFDRENGRLTGVLRETAQDAVRRAVPPPTEEELIEAIERAASRYAARGITSQSDASVGRYPGELAAWKKAAETGRLRLRSNLMVLYHVDGRKPGPGAYLVESGIGSGYTLGRLRIGPIKLFQDGSGGGATAAMREPYINDPNNRGIAYYEQDELDDIVARAHRAGFQVAIHAIGDRAMDMVVSAYEKALNRWPRPNHRHRIEHAGIHDERLLDKIQRLQLVVVPQPSFFWYLGDAYLKNLDAKRLRYAYPFRSWQERNVVAAASSDSPVVDFDPFRGLYSLLTRRTIGGQTISPEETVDIVTALKMYTRNGAYASFEEHIKGTLEPGKLADMVIIDGDILNTPVEEIPNLQVDATYVGGELVYVRE